MAKAQIEVSVTGAEEAAAKVDKLKASFKRFGVDINGMGAAIGNAISGPVNKMAGQLAGLASASEVNLARGAAAAYDFGQTVNRQAAASGKSVDALKAKYKTLAEQNMVAPSELASWAGSVGKATGNIDGAVDSFSSLNSEALLLGRSVDEMAPFAEMMSNTYHKAGDLSNILGVVNAQADAMNVAGGRGALLDQVTALVDGADLASTSVERLSGMIAELGKGLPKGRGGQIASQFAHMVEAKPFEFARLLHKKNLDEYRDPKTGEINDLPRLMADTKKYGLEQFREKGLHRRLVNTVGEVNARAIEHYDPAEADRLGNMPPKPLPKPPDLIGGTVEGDALKKKLARDKAEQEAGGKLQPASSWLDGVVANHPILGTLGIGAGGSLAMAGVNGLLKALTGGAGKVITAGATELAGAGGAGAGAAGAGGLGAAGLAMAGLGTAAMAGLTAGAGYAGDAAGRHAAEKAGAGEGGQRAGGALGAAMLANLLLPGIGGLAALYHFNTDANPSMRPPGAAGDAAQAKQTAEQSKQTAEMLAAALRQAPVQINLLAKDGTITTVTNDKKHSGGKQ